MPGRCARRAAHGLLGGALSAALAGSGDAGGQSDSAVQLVPPDAQLYMHANVDQSSSQWRTGQRLTTRLSSLRRLVEQA